MVLTRDFKETIQERVEHDTTFREALLTEGLECVLAGDLDTGRTIIRDYIVLLTSDSPGSPRRRR